MIVSWWSSLLSLVDISRSIPKVQGFLVVSPIHSNSVARRSIRLSSKLCSTSSSSNSGPEPSSSSASISSSSRRRSTRNRQNSKEQQQQLQLQPQQLVDISSTSAGVATTKTRIADSATGLTKTPVKSNIPHVVFQNDEVALVFKPAGISMTRARTRNGPGLVSVMHQPGFFQDASVLSNEETERHDRSRHHRIVAGRERNDERNVNSFFISPSPLNTAVSGLVPVAKTTLVEKILKTYYESDAMNCTYVAVILEEPSKLPTPLQQNLMNPTFISKTDIHTNFNDDDDGMTETENLLLDIHLEYLTMSNCTPSTVVSTSYPFMSLPTNSSFPSTSTSSSPAHLIPDSMSLVTFTLSAQYSVDQICTHLAKEGKYVVGYRPSTQHQPSSIQEPREGGVFLSMAHVTLPACLTLLGDEIVTEYQDGEMYYNLSPQIDLENKSSSMIPKKFLKLLKREQLHWDRLVSIQRTEMKEHVGGDMFQKEENGKEQSHVVEFRGLKLRIGRGELVPRASSGILVREALRHLTRKEGNSVKNFVGILDLGCGCGALVLATMSEWLKTKKRNKSGITKKKGSQNDGVYCLGVGIDLDANALEWARYNGESITLGEESLMDDHDSEDRCGSLTVHSLSCGEPWVDPSNLTSSSSSSSSLLSSEAHLALLQADFGQLHTPSIRSVLPARGFDVILCNPPYLSSSKPVTRTTITASKKTRSRITLEEDRALYAGDDGKDAYRAIASSLSLCDPSLLAPGGIFCIQLPGACSPQRRHSIAKIFTAKPGWEAYEAPPDERGIVRCLIVRNNRNR